MLADTFPGSYFGMAFAVYGMAVIVAPALGPTIGGWITDNFSWRWIFFMNLPVGALSLLLTHRLVQDGPARWRRPSSTAATGSGSTTSGLPWWWWPSAACKWSWIRVRRTIGFGSPFICVFAAVAILGLIGLVIWEVWIEKAPIVDLRLLANVGLSSSMVLQFVMGFILNSTTVLIPQFAQQILGYNATNAGLLIMPGGLLLMLGFPSPAP